MVGRRKPPVAPRIPDLRDLPNYYPQCLAAWLAAWGGVFPTPAESRAFRDYFTLLRNQALVGTLFSTRGRINGVLGLTVRHVRQGGTIVTAVPITGKGRKERPLRLDEDAHTWIAQYLQTRQPLFGAAPALFISHGPRGAGSCLTDVTGWRIVKMAADALPNDQVAEGASETAVQNLRAVAPHAIRHYVA
jgi:integrase/recombinase XerD